jgi:hypothetical protein
MGHIKCMVEKIERDQLIGVGIDRMIILKWMRTEFN